MMLRAQLPGGRLLPFVAGPVLVAAVLAGTRGGGVRPSASPPWAGDEEARRREELEEESRAVQARLMTMHLLAVEVAEGRHGLLEAVAHFRALHGEARTFHWDLYRAYWKGGSDEERHCREVIAYATWATLDPEKRRRDAERLERELQELLRRGPLRFPDVGPLPAMGEPSGPRRR
jgi:hypothetical protein